MTAPEETPREVAVLEADPDLAADLGAERRASATAACLAERVDVPQGPWPGAGERLTDGLGFLVLEGLLIRRVGLAGRNGAELLGQGDLLRPWHDDEEAPTLPVSSTARVLAPARLAHLDLEFTRVAAEWPEVLVRLMARAVQRSRQLAINMTIVHQPRIDLRLQMLLWQLAGRWGRVVPGGISLQLPLTHAVLAELIASRRPTVTSALGELTRNGVLEPLGEGWLLRGGAPRELVGAATDPDLPNRRSPRPPGARTLRLGASTRT